ncbi:unnamed protein product [Thelazia callipaeda]|uniref:DUF4378 domain-containing protein n=1 Tax=Thelazia callipaeda TaxID=103827 RepID=A0A0N5D2K4_THECL|nr:unnamed protein product [Thelazia callipaeda]
MNAIEKLDKILRRLSSKNRRGSTRSILRSSDISGLCRHEDNFGKQQVETSNNGWKTKDDSRGHFKSIVTAIQNIEMKTKTKLSSVSEKYFCLLTEEQTKKAVQRKNEFHEVQGEVQTEYCKISKDRMLCCDKYQTSATRMLLPSLPLVTDDLLAEITTTVDDKSRQSQKTTENISDYSVSEMQDDAVRKVTYDMEMYESLPSSCRRESSYLSGADVRHCLSTTEPSTLSSLSSFGMVFSGAQPRFHRTVETIMKHSFDVEMQKKNKNSLKVIAVPRQFDLAENAKFEDREVQVLDYGSTAQLLQDSIIATKYITTVFEFSSGGIPDLIDDVLNEFNLWFQEETGLLGIACEVQWSVPEKHRHLTSEIRMKEALHHSLRLNNRRVLNMKSKSGYYRLPLTMISAVTEENCSRDCQFHCFQGVYRRFYTSLLSYQHTDTSLWHRPYWNLCGINQTNSPKPNPTQFVFGRECTKLDSGSLVAINVVALKITL